MEFHESYIIKSSMILAIVLAILIAPISTSQSPVIETNGIPAGWSDDINLSQSTMGDSKCSIAVSGNDVHVIWRHTYVSAADYQVVYKKSNDCGRTWNSYVNISKSDLMGDDSDIASFDDDIHAVWENFSSDGINKVYYRNSNNAGQSWNIEKRISAPTGLDALGPNIFVNDSNIHISWHDKRDGADGEIYYRRSLDGGTTWDNGQGVNEDRRITFSPAAISGCKMTGDGMNISVVWADERDGDWEIYWMISKDNGYTWEDGLGVPNVGRKLSDDTSESGAVTITQEGPNIYVAWRDEYWPGPEYRIYYRKSTDNGVTWNPIQLLSGPNTASFAPNIAAYENKIWLMWNDNRDGSHEIFFKNSTDGGISWESDTRLTEMDSFTSGEPKIALNNSNIHVIWTDQRDGQSEIYYKRYPDFPDTSPPSHTNETPPQDSYKDTPGTEISVHVTDTSGVNESTIQLYVNGSLVSHILTPITDGYNVSYDSGGFGPGIVTCRIVAEDNCGNQLDYTWNFTVLALYSIQLHEGWNLISVPFVQVNTSIKEVLKDIDGKWDLIEYYDSTSGEWKSYATFWPESLNEFDEINNTMAIWINITEPDVNLTSRGIISTYTEIPLKAGWNFVGYPTQTTETVGNALWRTGADRVDVFDPTDPYRTKEVASTYIMKPGEGYWVHVVADSIWAINW